MSGNELLSFERPDQAQTQPSPATWFERDVKYVQSELNCAASELGEQGLYVGEWHSHLESNPEPSDQDVQSMSGIANAENYDTQCPVLLIAGIDKTSGKVTQLKTWAFQSGRRMESIRNSAGGHE